MYWKLAIQNIRRSLRDYIIYFVTLTFTALCDVLLFRDELFYYESFGLFAVLILVQLAATGVARSAANAPQRTERNAAADSCYAGNAGRICLIKRFTVINRNDWFR